MNANRQHDASKLVKLVPIITSPDTRKVTWAEDQISGRFTRELVWVLISILLLLYILTTYVYWAKTGSVWP
jgi:hypothetical protein